MIYTRRNVGTCSMATRVQLSESGIVEKVEVAGGCDGNLKGICSLVVGMPAQEAAAQLKGIRCGRKATSCPDQIALALEEALEQNTWKEA